MIIEALLIQYGTVPPAGGPAREKYVLEHGRKALQQARAELTEARSIIGSRWGRVPPRSANVTWSEWDETESRKEWHRLRESLTRNQIALLKNYLYDAEKHAVDAFNYLETTNLSEIAHGLIHEAGRLRGGILGCRITASEDHLWIDCRTRIAHLRTGMSVGMTADLVCSICDHPVEDCDHIPGGTYQKQAGKLATEACSICEAFECNHDVGEYYAVEAVARAEKITPHEISHVRYPRYPLCRISKIGLPAEPRGTIYTQALEGGLHCEACTEPCGGMREMPGKSSDFAGSLAQYQPAQNAKRAIETS